MKKTLLGAVSAFALLTAIPAYAQANAEQTHNPTTQNSTALERGWDKTKDTVSKAAEDVSHAAGDVADAAKEKYTDIKANLIDNNQETEISMMSIKPDQTATGMIGAVVYNDKGESVAQVSDIILDRDGKAAMVVVSDGEIFGLGKKVAFDYSVITRQDENGHVIAPLTEAEISKAARFSYNAAEQGEGIRVIPSDGYSVATLLDGQLVDQNKKAIGEVDNIVFVNGKAENLIVGFNDILGIGGEKAALPYKDAMIIADSKDKKAYDFQLGAQHAAEFEAYKAKF